MRKPSKTAPRKARVPTLSEELKGIVARRKLSARELSRLSGKDSTIFSRFLSRAAPGAALPRSANLAWASSVSLISPLFPAVLGREGRGIPPCTVRAESLCLEHRTAPPPSSQKAEAPGGANLPGPRDHGGREE